MSEGKIAVYSLGKKGVNVDQNQLQLEDDEFTKAQNVIGDPLGADAGIKNRPGIIKFNSTAAAGSILGGIGVPLFNQLDSTSIHTFYFARTGAVGWRKSTDAWATGSNTSGTPAGLRSSGASPVSDFNVSTSHNGHPGCVSNNRLYYAGNDFTAGSTSPTVRVFDGVVDKQFCRIPYNPDVGVGTFSRGVVSMLAANNTIYIATLDGGTTDGDFRGRVFQMNPDNAALTQIGPTITTGHVPYSLWYYLGRLWLGTARRTHSNLANIYWIRPLVDTAWALDVTMPTGQFIVTQMATYKGELYVTTVSNLGNSGQIRKRTTLGVWSLIDISTSTADNDGFYSIVEFSGNLYSGSTGTAQKVIRKWDGTTGSTVFSSATAGQLNNAYVHNGRIYISSGTTSGGSTDDLVSSANGTSWTSHTTALNGDEGQGVFVALTS